MRELKDVIEELARQMIKTKVTSMNVTIQMDNYGKVINFDALMTDKHISPIKLEFTLTV